MRNYNAYQRSVFLSIAIMLILFTCLSLVAAYFQAR